MSNSIEFVRNRALASRNAQAVVAAPPTNPVWLWPRKTVAQWDADITALDQARIAESAARVAWRNAVEVWQGDIDRVRAITRDCAGYGVTQFSADAVKHALFEALAADGRSRGDIYEQGLAARDLWTVADATWKFTVDGAEVTLAEFGSLLVNCIARQGAASVAFTAWRMAAGTVQARAEALDAVNVDWYADATRRFGPATAEGQMIRSAVPTTSRPEQPVGPAAITETMVSGQEIHLDLAAEHATSFTVLQQTPGSPAFVVVAADLEDAHFTLHGQVAGTHRFKAVGRNSQGEGPQSPVVEVTVAASAAA